MRERRATPKLDRMRLAWLLVPALAFAAAGCGGGTKAGGGELRHTIVFTIANHETEGRDLTEYVASVDRLSAGSLRLEQRQGWREKEIDYDRHTLADVRTGKLALAKIAVGSLGTLGAHELDALTAPFLVDSLALEQTVLASPLADEMLTGVDRLGVVGVSMLAGEPRRPFGQRGRFLGPADYRGALFGITPSRVEAATLEALGAKPRDYIFGELPYSFAGAELDLATIEAGNYDTSVTSATGNVVFGPRAFVVVMNRNVFAKLAADQRRIMRTAGREAVYPAIARLRTEERDETGILCRRGQLTFVKASRRQVDALHFAVRRVYATLERDPKVHGIIDEIEAMKRRSPPERAIRCARALSRQRAVTPLDGTWEMTAGSAHGIDGGDYRLVLRRGKMVLTHLSAPRWTSLAVFTVRGGTLQIRDADGGDAFFRWNVYRDALTLSYTRERIGAPNPTYANWYRVGR